MLVFFIFAAFLTVVAGECPWPREAPEYGPLNAACLCALNIENAYSIQCSSVKFPLLMRTLHRRAKNLKFELLYVNNSIINMLGDRTFYGLRIKSIQLSFSGISNITDNAFETLDESLENLNLQDNKIQVIPSKAFSTLKALSLLDLSNNRIISIPDRAFMGMQISTLKLSGNPISVYPNAFGGLEDYLKNLNLKACSLPLVPSAIRSLHSLAFLDLAQNEITMLDEGGLSTLDSLSALNLERNQLQDLKGGVFKGITDTLSSLSLLNNLLIKFPVEAIGSLPRLRVLDIGFNLISRFPSDSFSNLTELTLLAVDGNPLSTIPEKVFNHLKGTLRGLSVGGRYLVCDCRVSWITRWIRDYDLQVTSRDRDPQFCGSPEAYRERTFYQLKPSDLYCEEIPEEDLDPAENRADLVSPSTVEKYDEVLEKDLPSSSSTTTTTTTPVPKKTPTTYKPSTPKPKPIEPENPQVLGTRNPGYSSTQQTNMNRGPPIRKPQPLIPDQTSQSNNLQRQNIRREHSPKTRVQSKSSRPLRPQEFFSTSREALRPDEVIVQDAYWNDNAINIQWDSEVTNILGFRVVYRLFGDDYFKLAQPLSATEREFKIKNVPPNEYFVVCVVSLEEMDIKPVNVPFGQCREIKTGDHSDTLSTHMDTIIIAASAAICGTVVLAVIIFICCNRGRKQEPEKQGIPAVLNPSSPLASLGALGSSKTDWDTISMYSQRSIPRARMYHMDKDDARSHVSQMSTRSKSRSFADGQSQRSYGGFSGIHQSMGAFVSPLGLSRPDLRLSRQSLTASQFGGSVAPFAQPGERISRAPSQRSDRRRSRSKSRERSSSRLSHAGSSHSLTGYDTDGWTDHDMDIYMARNPTRGGLVQL